MKVYRFQYLIKKKIPNLENAIGMISNDELQMNVDNGAKIWCGS